MLSIQAHRKLAGSLALLFQLCAVPALAMTEETRSIGFSSSSTLFAPQSERKASVSSLTAHWHGSGQGRVVDWGARATAVLQFGGSAKIAPYFEAAEAYLSSSRKLAPVTLGIGRKLEEWNQLDEYWRLGIWQPRFRWDYIRPETVGLTGGYLTLELPGVRVVGFATPVFIPERGVDIAIANGSMSSASPWFIPPPSQMLVLDRPTPVAYSLEIPPIQEIVFRPSAGVLARVGAANSRQEGAWASAGLSWKPMNQLLLAYDGFLQHSSSGPQVVRAMIYPRVGYHRVISAEAGYNSPSVRGWVSTLYDRPDRDITPGELTRQEVSPAFAFAPTLDFMMPGLGKVDSRMELGYLQVKGGSAPDTGRFAKGNGTVFDGRYPFTQAVVFGMRSRFAMLGGFGERVSASTRLLRDLAHPGSIYSMEISVRPAPAWNVQLAADILGSDMPQDPSVAGSDYIGRYRGNDRFYGEISYVF
ncbi:MAG: hypothetical protein NDJ89_13955 [Oligoflexia bacterium]|nr:hypothetical protein [Oligoflexia bacterium]